MKKIIIIHILIAIILFVALFPILKRAYNSRRVAESDYWLTKNQAEVLKQEIINGTEKTEGKIPSQYDERVKTAGVE